MDLNKTQLERYSRNIMLSEIGMSGQIKLLESKVLIIGAGGLGSPCALYLAAAGVGTIGIADADLVDLSNLQRQIAHATQDVGKAKVQSAMETLRSINPDVEVRVYRNFVNAANIMHLISDYDFIIDCTDNFPSKFLINDACVIAKKPFSHAGVARFAGQLMTYVPQICSDDNHTENPSADTAQNPCYRCIFESPPPPDPTPCVINVMPGVIGSMQAMEAIKYIIGKGELLTGHLLTYDALKMSFRKIKLPKMKTCAVCGDNPTILQPFDDV